MVYPFVTAAPAGLVRESPRHARFRACPHIWICTVELSFTIPMRIWPVEVLTLTG
jgi:hypothetical protein